MVIKIVSILTFSAIYAMHIPMKLIGIDNGMIGAKNIATKNKFNVLEIIEGMSILIPSDSLNKIQCLIV
jgi:hypothetical protein